jgi:hypothetical protein
MYVAEHMLQEGGNSCAARGVETKANTAAAQSDRTIEGVESMGSPR